MRAAESTQAPVDLSCNPAYVEERRLLVDWVCELAAEFRLQPNTAHVAVVYMDGFVSSNTGTFPHNGYFRLLAIACLSLACKYQEPEEILPSMDRLLGHLPEGTHPRIVHLMEVEVIRQRAWCLSTTTPLQYVGLHVARGVVFEGDKWLVRREALRSCGYISRFSTFFVELCTQEAEFLSFTPSLIAAATIVATRRAQLISPMWTPQLEPVLGYSWAQVRPVFVALWSRYARDFGEQAKSVDRTWRDEYSAMGSSPVSALGSAASPGTSVMPLLGEGGQTSLLQALPSTPIAPGKGLPASRPMPNFTHDNIPGPPVLP